MFTKTHIGRILGIALLAAFLAHPTLAHGQAAPVTSCRVNTTSSHVYARVNTATRLGHVHGIEGKLAAGSLELGGAGDLVFDITSFVADTPEAREYVGLEPKFSRSDAKKVQANMLGSDVLDAAQFPKAVYTARSIRPLDGQQAGHPGHYQFDGQFTLHGVSRPLQFNAEAKQTDKPGALHVIGSFTINQTDYGIQPYSALGGFIKVADQLTIWGDLILLPVNR